MFDHYVMFRLRADKRSELETFVAKLQQLRADVPAIRELWVRRNARQGPKSHDLLYFARFGDRAGFEAYMKHPLHVPVMKYVDEVCDAVADVDVED